MTTAQDGYYYTAVVAAAAGNGLQYVDCTNVV